MVSGQCVVRVPSDRLGGVVSTKVPTEAKHVLQSESGYSIAPRCALTSVHLQQALSSVSFIYLPTIRHRRTG